MTDLRNDSRNFGCVSSALAAALFCLVAATAGADEIAAAEDPLIAAIDAFIDELELDKTDKGWKSKVPVPAAEGEFNPRNTYYWNLHTNKGDIKIKLLPQSAPLHFLSTIYLTRLGFYDGVKFHRIVKDFMAQGGDPTGRGNGGPAYRFDGEFDPGLSHDKKGVVSAANAGPGTDGSQFFITFGPAKRLDGKHTIFGEMIDGEAVLKKIERAGSREGKPRRKVIIKKATIVVEPPSELANGA